MARKLRIAVSVFFAVLTVALCVMWVRSRTFIDLAGVAIPATQWLYVMSCRGELELACEKLPSNFLDTDRFAIHSQDMTQMFEQHAMALSYNFSWTTTPAGFRATSPIWVFVALAAIFAAAPWLRTPWLKIPSRFSVRTMLIATTLVAVVLGLGVWLAS